MLRTLTLGAVAGLLLAGAATAQPYGAQGYGPPPPPRYGAPPPSMGYMGGVPAPEFVRRAGQSDQFEIQSSQLALSRSRDGGVRRFADMMIRDHNYTTSQVMRASRRSGRVPPMGPPPLRPDQRAMVGQLQYARGYEFDRLYATQQVQSHEEALSLMQTYAASGDEPGLRRVAAEAAPIVQHHLEMARNLASGRSRY